jgi:hypothetical protein
MYYAFTGETITLLAGRKAHSIRVKYYYPAEC